MFLNEVIYTDIWMNLLNAAGTQLVQDAMLDTCWSEWQYVITMQYVSALNLKL